MADDILKNIPLPADLPENWTSGQIVAPTGAEAGLDEQHGYNYLMMQVNNAQKALKVLAAQREEDLARIRYWISDDPTSPASFIGGTWEQIKDRFILAAGDTYAAGSTGGEATHTLTVNEIAKHNHEQRMWLQNIYSGVDGTWKFDTYGYLLKQSDTANPNASDYVGKVSNTIGGYTNFTGSSQPHNNMPPYIATYVWKRIA